MATLAQPAPRTIAPLSVPVTQRIGRGLVYALLIAIGLILFTPFILAFLGTFKTDYKARAEFLDLIHRPPR